MQIQKTQEIIHNINLYDERDQYVIQIQFNEEGSREEQKPERISHYLIQGIDFITDNQNLKIQLNKNELKEINPYILLQKLIDKIYHMSALFKQQKDFFRYSPIVKNVSFNWIYIDLELQFFEKPSSQHQIQIQETFKARLSNILYTDLLKEINLKISDESSFYQVQIIKKITDKEQQKYSPEMLEDNFFMNQVYSMNEPIVHQLELLCLILYLINYDINKNKQYYMEDYFDFLLFSKRIKHLPQNRSVCLYITRVVQTYQNDYFQEIATNPFIIYKSMPFSLTFYIQDCIECQTISKKISEYVSISHQMQLQNIDPEQIKQKKEIYENQISDLKQKVQQHTRVINLQINVIQDIFQNQYQYNDKICQYMYTYLKTLQTLYSRFFTQLENILNPTKNQTLKIFEPFESNFIGTIFNRQSHSIQIRVILTDQDKLDIFYKNLKSYTCQIQKLLRQVYFMNLIGKDPNDLESLNVNQPQFNFDLNDDMINQQIAFEIKRYGLLFSIVVKPKFINQSKILFCDILFKQALDSNNTQIFKENKDIRFQDLIKLMFKSVYSFEIDQMPIQNQIKHMTNYYDLICQFLKNQDDELYIQIIKSLEELDKNNIFTDFSKKDLDIKNIEGKGFQQPKYLFEIKSFYEMINYQRFFTFSIKIYFGKCIQNKLFILMEIKPNEVEVKQIQVADIQQHIKYFMNKYTIFQ
ncbi:hypothetical protein TTHERM_000732838 (macronuclear) [Tetrahymena thermophila SB210]|uniref:Uncharacterized protein n=1 Tax=Tetrahymena thermophila (strain SB210) TaxID=312017 RepID=W7X6X9_TETTS|nr:hypothetical protein TTHERM_000732838 [Tetrahymena thermophila SB210]EWS72143.1 hypothetical protein TTHERM_000732838 [Tetrahymena thermophila SB210]|eukprot:XP_012655336.1 hypothetical protein TTHERM_000732838 [Tetrahymena thermophila SB210]